MGSFAVEEEDKEMKAKMMMSSKSIGIAESDNSGLVGDTGMSTGRGGTTTEEEAAWALRRTFPSFGSFLTM